MAALMDVYVKIETLQTLLDVVTKKGEKGLSITVSLNDSSDQYGNNVNSFVAQTKEQREAKKPKFYIGNGKVFWTNHNTPELGVKPPAVGGAVAGVPASSDDDLPF